VFFFVDSAKVLRLWELGWGYPLFARQNIDSMGVAGKILRNKELGATICSIPGSGWNEAWTSHELKLGRTLPLSASRILGQGRTSKVRGLFLWRAVENRSGASRHSRWPLPGPAKTARHPDRSTMGGLAGLASRLRLSFGQHLVLLREMHFPNCRHRGRRHPPK